MKWPFEQRANSLDRAELLFFDALMALNDARLTESVDTALSSLLKIRRTGDETVFTCRSNLIRSDYTEIELCQIAGIRYEVHGRQCLAELCLRNGSFSSIFFGPDGRDAFLEGAIKSGRSYHMPDVTFSRLDEGWLIDHLIPMRLPNEGVTATQPCSVEVIEDLEWRLGTALPVSLREYLEHHALFRVGQVSFDGGLLARYTFPWVSDCFVVADWNSLARYLQIQSGETASAFVLYDQLSASESVFNESLEQALGALQLLEE
ncbi:MAG: SMI1/KNR4 family protein [Fimbriimonadaceae bacterium]|nr:SMI1/KNR4 family protein [Fimbriimonadaceae bacterium]